MLKTRKFRDKFNQLACRIIRGTQPTLSLDGERAVLTIFHDYEGEYALPGKASASLHGVTTILDSEKRHGVKATFNTVGKLILDVPDVIERIVAEGHEMASHSFSHEILAGKNRADLENDLSQTMNVFASLGLRLRGVRSPQSRWSFLQTRIMAENGLDWSAENDSNCSPFFIRGSKPNGLVRLPVIFDDWEYESHKLSAEQMYTRLVEKVELLVQQNGYGAIGFHPWVQGEQDERLEVFDRFLAYVAQHDRVRTVTFSEASSLARSAA